MENGSGEQEREFLRRVSRAIQENSLVRAGETVLVACSGGVDSMVLLDVMARIGRSSGFSVAAAHLDHGLRGREGWEDQRTVALFCQRNGILFVGGEEDVGHASREPGVSLQDAARRVRYTFLRQSLLRTGSERIATAHHADDQVETVLMRLLRGTGLRGLSGIPVRGDDETIRPLLREWKADIRSYADARGIPYREDPSNRTLRYHRNRVRNHLLPVMEGYNPSVKEAIFRLSMWAAEERDYVDDRIDETLEAIEYRREKGEITLNRSKLLSCRSFEIKEILRRAFEELGLWHGTGSIHLERALHFIREGESGRRIDLPGDLVIGRDFEEIYLQRKTGWGGKREYPSKVVEIEAEWHGEFRTVNRTWHIRVTLVDAGEIGDRRGEPNHQYFNPECLSPPVQVRRWEHGDRLNVRGMKGRKRVSELLSEAGVPRRKRRDILVLEDRESLLWVIGVRRGSRGMVTEGGGKVISVHVGFVDEPEA